MDKSGENKKVTPVRRAIFGGAVGGLGGIVGAIIAKPLVSAFGDSAPWVLPVIAAGFISAVLLAALLIPLYLRRVPRD
jgi:uncharacterized membrane protein YeaQ/YmgE (transglycosylase-associated protein family)